MHMSRVEKLLANRDGKAGGNIARVRERLRHLNTASIRHVLELGCGTGAVSASLARHYPACVYGPDNDAAQIALAQQQHRQPGSFSFPARSRDTPRLSRVARPFCDQPPRCSGSPAIGGTRWPCCARRPSPGDMATAHLRPILVESHVAHPVGLVFDALVPPHHHLFQEGGTAVLSFVFASTAC